MTRLLHTAVILLIVGLACEPDAFAQRSTFRDRGFIIVNGGYQATSNDFDKTSTLRVNVEDGSFTTDYIVKGGPTFDIAGGATLGRRFGVGVGVTRFSRSTPSRLNGSVPHPFFFDRSRAVTGAVSGLKREELAVHVQARALAPIGSHLQVSAFGGPSFFNVKQGLVTTFTWTESYPFDTAAFASASTASTSGSKVGFNAGADVAYFFTHQLGAGVSAQFSGTTLDLDVPGGGTVEVKAGGFQVGGGVRLRF